MMNMCTVWNEPVSKTSSSCVYMCMYDVITDTNLRVSLLTERLYTTNDIRGKHDKHPNLSLSTGNTVPHQREISLHASILSKNRNDKRYNPINLCGRQQLKWCC